MKMLDANYVLRFILHDNEKMAEIVKAEILSGAVYISDAVLEEVVHVLKKVYQIERTVISAAILQLIALQNIKVQSQTVIEICMKYYSETSLDFVDCLLAAYHTQENYEICTFDKKLNRLMKRLDSDAQEGA